jgi:outer membrane protein assembly factor BamB
MNCDTARDWLELFVLDELTGEEREAVSHHVAQCENCQAEVTALHSLIGDLRADAVSGAPSATGSLAGAIQSAVRAELAVERRRRIARRAVAGIGAIAALLLIAVSIWFAQPRSQPDRWQLAGAEALTDSLADEVVVSGETAYLLRSGHLRAYVAAVDARTGRQQWRSAVPSIGYLAAGDSGVYCLGATRPGTLELTALDAATGQVLWRHARAGVHPRRALAPLPCGDRICWAAGDELHLLNAADGDPVWSVRVGAAGRLSNPVRDGDSIYVAGPSAVHAFDLDSGARGARWPFAPPGSTRGRPVLGSDGERLFVAAERLDGTAETVAFEAATGAVAWRRNTQPAKHLVASGGVVCLRDKVVAALDAESGRPLWSRQAAGCGPLSAADGRVHFVDTAREGSLVALDARTGRRVWTVGGVRSCDAFAQAGDTGLIKTRDGVVHAIAMRD